MSLSFESTYRVNPESIAESLQISPDHARLVLETIACVLHSVSDPLIAAKPSEIGSVGVNVFDLLVFLYIQSYKRLLPKGHKDSAAVADVWPSTSAFDGFLSALSPLQVSLTLFKTLACVSKRIIIELIIFSELSLHFGYLLEDFSCS